MIFVPTSGTNGVTDLKVTTDGYLLLACNFDDQGNREGSWNQEAWTSRLDYEKRKISQALELFRVLRSSNYDLLRDAPPEVFARSVLG